MGALRQLGLGLNLKTRRQSRGSLTRKTDTTMSSPVAYRVIPVGGPTTFVNDSLE
jgi:hypothetical protein